MLLIPPGGTPGSRLPGGHPCRHAGAAYPRIRAGLLTYWRGPGGRFAGTEARTARRGCGLSADKGSTADILAGPGGRFAGAEARTARRGGRLSADNVSTADILAGPGGRFAGAGAQTARRGGRLSADKVSTADLLAGPGGWFAGREARTARQGGAAYPRIRAVSLTYWPGPGGWFAGAEARTARRGGRLPADKVSTADILVQPGGRFAGAEARTVRRGGRLPADKGRASDLLAHRHPNRPPGRQTGQRPPRPMAGALHPPGRALPFGRVAYLFRHGGLSADKVSTADILARAGQTTCRGRGANSPAKGALIRG